MRFVTKSRDIERNIFLVWDWFREVCKICFAPFFIRASIQSTIPIVDISRAG